MTRTLPAKNLREAEIAFPLPELAHLGDFVGIVGAPVWRERLAELQTRIAASNRQGSVLRQRHSLELALDRLLNRGPESRTKPPLSAAETRLALISAECVTLAKQLTPEGRERLRERLQAALSDDNTLVDLFHLLRTGALYRERGFTVSYAKLEELASYDLLLSRDDVEAECVCDTVSAEIGRDIHRVAWARFCDLAEANLKAWLEGRPGRYLLKMTLTRGLTDAEPAMVDSLHDRLKTMLTSGNRLDQDPNATLRLEPLSLAGTATTATEEGLIVRLRHEFGPEAHLSVAGCSAGVWAMAARAGKRNEIAGSVHSRLDVLAPSRLSGTRPGILSLFLEDIDRHEWRVLRESLELEGAARHFMTCGGASAVAAVTCYSRMEMFGLTGSDAVADGELRFRNPSHPAAKHPALAAAIASSN
jgi:hypothetical protein